MANDNCTTGQFDGTKCHQIHRCSQKYAKKRKDPLLDRLSTPHVKTLKGYKTPPKASSKPGVQE